MYVNVADAGTHFALSRLRVGGLRMARHQSVSSVSHGNLSVVNVSRKTRAQSTNKVFFAHLESGELITVFRIGSTCQLCRARIAEKKQ